jgi:DNA polymerase elongation subunit (family B)
MGEATDFVKQYTDVSGFEIYGNTNYVAQYLNDTFPGVIEWDRNIINVTSIDIETKFENGFPEPAVADQEVTAITCKNNIDDTYYVFGCGDYDTEKSIMQDNALKYIKCNDERELLMRFVIHMSSVDIITGWNVEFFDIPYLVNRIGKICGPEVLKKLSPWGDIKENTQRPNNFNPNPRPQFKIMGVTVLDYLDLFKKFGYSYGPQESYKLDHIASVVLGERKLSYDEFTDLNDLHDNNYQKFIDYNIKDVEIIDRFEDKMGLITLALTMAYKGGVNYTDVLGTVGIWDSIIYRDLSLKHIAIPQNKESFKGDYPGGYVKAPQVGKHDWVCSFDLNSLYPSIIMQYNMSPETIIEGKEHGVDVESFLVGNVSNTTTDTALALNGVRFSTTKTGVLPSIIEHMYTERVGIKKEMLEAQQEKEGIDQHDKTAIYAVEKKIAIAENKQMAIKILLNSLYGAMGNKWFRYFDMRIAEGITLTGQATIKWAEKHLNEYLNKIMETNDDYVVAIDTDSVYITLGELVNRINPPNPVDFLDKVCGGKLEQVLIDCYADLYTKLGGRTNKMVMGREVIANRGIWTAKKRYILNVYDNEGVRYTTPKLKIMGIEAIKSSTPAICRQALRDIFLTIINKEENDVQHEIAEFKKVFISASPEEVAFPRGVNEINKWLDEKTGYRKGTPIHVRGAILHNNYVKEKKLGNKINDITGGDKIKFTYLKKPNPIKENVISFIDFLPKQFKLEEYVDYNLQFEKTFMSVIEPILDSIGYKVEQVVTLEDFFS